MTVFVEATCRALERTFKSETIDQVKLSPHYYSCSRLSCLLNNEVAIRETEVLSVSTKEEWEDAFL